MEIKGNVYHSIVKNTCNFEPPVMEFPEFSWITEVYEMKEIFLPNSSELQIK